MKHFSLIVLMILVGSISACSPGKLFGPTLTATPTNTQTPTNTPTNTPTSTPTNTPILTATATPVTIGGGGTFIMQVIQALVPKEFNSQEPFYWFSASSDGSDLKLLNWQIWSISPDGKRALTYKKIRGSYASNEGSLTNLDGTGAIPLDDSLDYITNLYFEQTAIWLPNGNVAIIAKDQEQNNKASVYIVSPDGKLTIWEKPSQIMKDSMGDFLFITPDGENLFWGNDVCINHYCNKESTAKTCILPTHG